MNGVIGEAELLVRDDRAVMVRWHGGAGRKSKDDDGTGEDEAALGRHDAWNATVVAEGDLDDLVGVELAEALDEWARVCAAIARTGGAAGRQVVSRRGRQLVARVAAVLGGPVRYRDPMTDETTVVQPPSPEALWAMTHVRSHHGPRGRDRVDPTPPWGTGLTVAAFVAVFVVVAMLALAQSLVSETTGWVAVLAAAVVTGGLAPSLWLGRTVPIVRWIVLGTVAGTALSWIGVLFIAFA